MSSAYRRTDCASSTGDLGRPTASVDDSWRLLETTLPGEISKQIARRNPTHLVVMATGWRVDQAEAIKWMAQWRTQLEKYAGPDFRPLYLAITWPAHRWDGVLSFRNKAHDSDEVGLTWANVLINRTLPSAAGYEELPVVYLGHSYGARLLSTAVYAGAAIDAPCSAVRQRRLLLVGLQPAYSTGRFAGSAARDSKAYEAFSGCATKAVFVASRNDSAVAFAPSQYLTRDSAYLGGKRALDRAAKEDSDIFEIGEPLSEDKVYLIDGSAHVGNHSDVCTAWIGWRVAKLIDTFADPAGKVEVGLAQPVTQEDRQRSCSNG